MVREYAIPPRKDDAGVARRESADSGTQQLSDAHVQRSKEVLKKRFETIEKAVNGFVDSFRTSFENVRDDTVLHVERINPFFIKVWDQSQYVPTTNEMESLRQRKIVDGVRKRIENSSPDVAERIGAVIKQVEGNTQNVRGYIDAVINDLVQTPTLLSDDDNKKYTKAAGAAALEIQVLDKADVDEQKSRGVRSQADRSKEFSLQLEDKLRKFVPLPEIPSEITLESLRTLLDYWKERNTGQEAQSRFIGKMTGIGIE